MDKGPHWLAPLTNSRALVAPPPISLDEASAPAALERVIRLGGQLTSGIAEIETGGLYFQTMVDSMVLRAA